MSKKNENVAVAENAVVNYTFDVAAVEALAIAAEKKAETLKKERDALKDTDENKAHMKAQQMYKALGEARRLRGALALSRFLEDNKIELPADCKDFLSEMRGEKRTAGGGSNIFDDYFKGIDTGKIPLYCFLYMNSDGSRLSPATDQTKLMEGMMSGSIKERMNLNQLNKKLEELGLVATYKVDGQFLVKGM